MLLYHEIRISSHLNINNISSYHSNILIKWGYGCAKSSFFRAFKAIYSKVECTASEETVITLLHFKCLPTLLYATEACHMLAHDQSSLEFTTTRVFMNIFHTSSSAVIAECQCNFNFLSVQRHLTIRHPNFFKIFAASDNHPCSNYSFWSFPIPTINHKSNLLRCNPLRNTVIVHVLQ